MWFISDKWLVEFASRPSIPILDSLSPSPTVYPHPVDMLSTPVDVWALS